MSVNFKPPRGTLVNKSHPLARGLIACWLLNEGGGNTIFDLSGNGKNLVKEPTSTWVSGLGGTGIYQNAANEDTDIADFHVNHITMEARVNFVAALQTAHNYNSIVAKWEVTDDDCWHLGENNSGYSLWISTAGGDYGIDTGTFPQNTVTHVVGTYDGEASILYSDGVQVATNTSPSGNLNNNSSTPIYLGAQNYNHPDRWFPGTIFYVRIWDRALTAAEIQWLYREPYAMFEKVSSRGFLYVAPAAGDIVIFRRRRAS